MIEHGNRHISLRSRSLQMPFFMPDATRASIRGVTSEQLRSVGTEAVVVNTYHLSLQPGSDLIRRAGGIHAFMKWDGLVLSDSGGYQVYSLIHKNAKMGRITEEGAEFRSVLDGSKQLLTPERSIQIQFDLGVDMMVVLDDPRPNSAPDEEIDQAVSRSVRWAGRCRDEYERQIKTRGFTEETRPLLFGVVQGGKSRELRKKCVDGLIAFSFDGYGFGARHVDDDGTFLEDIVRYTAEILPEDKWRFALGVGTPSDIVQCYAYGWDMFDCVIPTREGRHGRLFLGKNNLSGARRKAQGEKKGTGYSAQGTVEEQDARCKAQENPTSQFSIPHSTPVPTSLPCRQAGNFQLPNSKFCSTFQVPSYETINITNGKYAEDFSVIEEGCGCPACAGGYTKAYLHHLFRVGEPLGGQLATLHNIFFYNTLMSRLQREGLRDEIFVS